MIIPSPDLPDELDDLTDDDVFPIAGSFTGEDDYADTEEDLRACLASPRQYDPDPAAWLGANRMTAPRCPSASRASSSPSASSRPTWRCRSRGSSSPAASGRASR